jgi:rubrerythrin
MNIFELATKKEQLSIDLYSDLAGRTANEGLRNILAMLAEEERKHLEMVSEMARGTPPPAIAGAALKNAVAVFRKMKKTAAHFVIPDSERELYAKARQCEEESRLFYLARTLDAVEAGQRELFGRLAAEEQKHFLLLDSICDFVSRPLNYLENAEFTHLEDYMEDRSDAHYAGGQ